jgi:hypothetical protein
MVLKMEAASTSRQNKLFNILRTMHYDINYLPVTNFMHKIYLFTEYYIHLHVSIYNMLILLRSKCMYLYIYIYIYIYIYTAFGIITLYK